MSVREVDVLLLTETYRGAPEGAENNLHIMYNDGINNGHTYIHYIMIIHSPSHMPLVTCSRRNIETLLPDHLYDIANTVVMMSWTARWSDMYILFPRGVLPPSLPTCSFMLSGFTVFLKIHLLTVFLGPDSLCWRIGSISNGASRYAETVHIVRMEGAHLQITVHCYERPLPPSIGLSQVHCVVVYFSIDVYAGGR